MIMKIEMLFQLINFINQMIEILGIWWMSLEINERIAKILADMHDRYSCINFISFLSLKYLGIFIFFGLLPLQNQELLILLGFFHVFQMLVEQLVLLHGRLGLFHINNSNLCKLKYILKEYHQYLHISFYCLFHQLWWLYFLYEELYLFLLW
jgi:hypothetical protein